jgi:hypothetical protein
MKALRICFKELNDNSHYLFTFRALRPTKCPVGAQEGRVVNVLRDNACTKSLHKRIANRTIFKNCFTAGQGVIARLGVCRASGRCGEEECEEQAHS